MQIIVCWIANPAICWRRGLIPGRQFGEELRLHPREVAHQLWSCAGNRRSPSENRGSVSELLQNGLLSRGLEGHLKTGQRRTPQNRLSAMVLPTSRNAAFTMRRPMRCQLVVDEGRKEVDVGNLVGLRLLNPRLDDGCPARQTQRCECTL
jgi:hypothetical protein